MAKQRALILPAVTLGAEHLVMGYLLRRNILAYKAPPNNEGYDILCIHPDPKKVTKQLRIQVKSRYQTDCDRAFPIKEKSMAGCDYVIGVFQNIGNFFRRKQEQGGVKPPEFYTLPIDFVIAHHEKSGSGFGKLRTRQLDLEKFKNEKGFELIAQELGVVYPSKRSG